MASVYETMGPDVGTAGLYISQCIQKDFDNKLDLIEALEASKYSSRPYLSHPKKWPSLAEIAETHELPPLIVERYNAHGVEGTTALCGIFPEIRRAWASIHNSVFLWRFDKCDEQCTEYTEEETICAVGLAKSKPGIFMETIQYLLLLVTPIKLCLIGVCCTGSGDGTDPYADISLQPLPDYTIPSDGVAITCIACADKGNIFVAGNDGNIYEIQYSFGSNWRKHCRKFCLTAGLGSLFSKWVSLNALKSGTVDPIIDMVVDNERHAIYARTEGMKLLVFDLGADGDGPFKKVAEEKIDINPKSVSHAVRPSIVCITPLSTIESKSLHFVVVVSDGRRIYLSTSSTGTSKNDSISRPCCLKIVSIIPSPQLEVHGGLTFGTISAAGRSQLKDLALKVESSFYSSGTFVISDSSFSYTSSLLMVSRDSSCMQLSSPSSIYGLNSKNTHTSREVVSSLPLEGRMLAAADILQSPDTAFYFQPLHAGVESFTGLGETCEKACAELWARGDLQIQHILPKRRIVIFGTMGLIEVVFNRPVHILKKMFENNASRSQIEEFFNRFGAGESASMCLMLGARLIFDEGITINKSTAEKAAEAFEDPGFVGMAQLNGSSNATTNAIASGSSFSMGQVVQEAEPVFSGAYEGICLCSSRLLFPIWELPVFDVRSGVSSNAPFDGVVMRISVRAMQILESKIRSLGTFLRSRRVQRMGLNDPVAGGGDFNGCILYGPDTDGAGRFFPRNTGNGIESVKKQRLRQTPAERAAIMEERAVESLRRLLQRSSEALFLLQLISNHHDTCLAQGLDNIICQRLVHLTFNQLVCSLEGDQLAMWLISRLIEFCIIPDGRVTVDEISAKLREGCPSYYNESDYKYFLAIECLERASVSHNADEREKLARKAFIHLTSWIPEDLKAVCRRFENLRFYQAVVLLPLQKAQTLDPNSDASNDKADPGFHGTACAQREQCYEIIMDAIRSLKGAGSNLDPSSRDEYIRQIIQLSAQWSDTDFRKYLYKTLIDLNLENELLEYGGDDLVSFLLNAARKSAYEVLTIASTTPVTSPMDTPSSPTKYLHILSKYFVIKREHSLAASILCRLAEMPFAYIIEAPTLEQRHQYLSDAILQAKSAHSSDSPIESAMNSDDRLLDVLETKLAVLRFQMRIKVHLELTASKLDNAPDIDESHDNDQFTQHDVEVAKAAEDKAMELTLNLKSITQLYNEYAVSFQLWEVCLDMLNFARYLGDDDGRIVRNTWARLLDKSLSTGGLAEACAVVKRVGQNLYPEDDTYLPLEILCFDLEWVAMERLTSGEEIIGDEDVARALLAACKGTHERALSIYDKVLFDDALRIGSQILSIGASVLHSAKLRLRLLGSVLVIFREWTFSVLSNKLGTAMACSSFVFGGTLSREQPIVGNRGMHDKIASACNRYITEVKRLPLSQRETEPVYRGFREIEKRFMLAPPIFHRRSHILRHIK